MTQSERVLNHLRRGKPITPIQALNRYGIFRLAARISDLKRDGYDIASKIVRKGEKKYAEYRMG